MRRLFGSLDHSRCRTRHVFGPTSRQGRLGLGRRLVIPCVEVDWHNLDEDFFWMWDDYHWSMNAIMGMEYETDNGGSVSAHSPGYGAAMNSYLTLQNVNDGKVDNELSNAGLHRSQDPGAGGFSPYYNRRSIATRSIAAGEELFVWYGENYFSNRPDVYGPMPFEQHFRWADQVLRRFLTLKQEHLPTDSAEQLWDLAKDIKDQFQDWELSRYMAALPWNNYTSLEPVAEVGTAKQHLNRSIVDVEWLEQHGKCADNLRPGLSKIPQAGRGAFATRRIPKDGLVAPAPLIHIPNRSRLDMYDEEYNEEGDIVPILSKGPVRQQLMLNYCFGHAKSTLLLNSYGSFVSFINHSKEPNARIVWADDMAHPEWLDFPTERLEEHNHAGLMFDYIALRDIEEGEEITIDYGDEWQAAWDEHVRNWKPPEGAETYECAYELNNEVDLVLRTVKEAPYPGNVKLWVREAYRLMAGLPETDTNWYRALILDRFERNGEFRYMAQIYSTEDQEKAERTLVTHKWILLDAPAGCL